MAAVAVVIICLIILLKKKRKGRKHSIWFKPWLTRRATRGIYNNLVRERQLEDEEEYKKLLRMIQVNSTETLETTETPAKSIRPT